MKSLAVASVLAFLLVPVAALATTFPIPSDNPIATVSIPDTWGPKPYDAGIEATSPDGKVYVAAESVKADDVAAATKEGLEWFVKQGVEIDEKSIKTEEQKLNGMSAYDISMTGTDKTGPTLVDMTLVATNSSTAFLMIYFWGSAEGVNANVADLKAIGESFQATK